MMLRGLPRKLLEVIPCQAVHQVQDGGVPDLQAPEQVQGAPEATQITQHGDQNADATMNAVPDPVQLSENPKPSKPPRLETSSIWTANEFKKDCCTIVMLSVRASILCYLMVRVNLQCAVCAGAAISL